MLKSLARNVLRLLGYEIQRVPYTLGPRDPFEIQKRLLINPAPRIIFDVGAHHGQTLKKYAVLFPKAGIHCFEPFPESFQVVEALALNNRQLSPYRLALTDSPGKRSFYVNQMSATNSLLPRPQDLRRYYPHNAGTIGQIEIEATTLDLFCQAKQIPSVDILKMDIQGGELLALKGAAGLLRDKRISLIYTEAAFVPHYAGAPLFYEVCEFLARYHYSLYDLFFAEHATNGQLRYGDAIFVSPELRANVVDVFKPEP